LNPSSINCTSKRVPHHSFFHKNLNAHRRPRGATNWSAVHRDVAPSHRRPKLEAFVGKEKHRWCSAIVRNPSSLIAVDGVWSREQGIEPWRRVRGRPLVLPTECDDLTQEAHGTPHQVPYALKRSKQSGFPSSATTATNFKDCCDDTLLVRNAHVCERRAKFGVNDGLS